jgi:predicted MFS family arabinose efflux permease
MAQLKNGVAATRRTARAGRVTATQRRTDRLRAMRTAVLGITVLYVGSTVLTPLYPIYEQKFGISEVMVSEIYAAYVVGNLAVLFFFGRLSDRLGRRPTTLAALGINALSSSCFLAASGAGWLFAGRVMSGFAAGLGAATLTAWISELEPNGDRGHAATVTSAGNLAGLTFGALAAGVLATLAPWPLRSSWLLYLAIMAGTVTLLWSTPETVERPVRRIADLELRPRMSVPRGIRTAFTGAAALAFASFALGGFYAALAPGLLVHRMGLTSVAVIGGVVGLYFGVAAIVALAARRLPPMVTLVSAVLLLLVGVGLLVLSDAHRALGLLLVGTVVCGAAQALGYRGSLQIVDEIAPAERRAELLAAYLLVCYTANSLPVLGVGLTAQATGPETAHRLFAGVVAVLALVAGGIGTLRRK